MSEPISIDAFKLTASIPVEEWPDVNVGHEGAGGNPLGEPTHVEGTFELTEEGRAMLEEMRDAARKRREAMFKVREGLMWRWTL